MRLEYQGMQDQLAALEFTRGILGREVNAKISSVMRHNQRALQKPLTKLGKSVITDLRAPALHDAPDKTNVSAYQLPTSAAEDGGRAFSAKPHNVTCVGMGMSELSNREAFKGDLEVVTAKVRRLEERSMQLAVTIKKKAREVAENEMEAGECRQRHDILQGQVHDLEQQLRAQVLRISQEAGNQLRKISPISINMYYPQ